MALLDTFIAEIQEDCPNAPYAAITRVLVRAAQDFFQRTRAWVVDATDITVVAGTDTYTVTLPSITDDSANPITVLLIGIEKATDENDTKVAGFKYYDGQIIFDDEPSTGFTLSLEVTIKPNSTATALPDNLLDLYSDAIFAGAKYRLLSMKFKEWSDPVGARDALLVYNQQIVRARINKWSEFGTKTLYHRPSNAGWE